VAAAAKLMDAKRGNVAEVIDAINSAQVQAEDQDPEEAALDHVAAQRGEAAPSASKSIKVDAGWYAGDWTDIRRVATALAIRFGLPLGDGGEISNTFLLERLLSLFVPREWGAKNIVQMFADTETITEEQAVSFLKEYANLPGDAAVNDGDEDPASDDSGAEE
jgi:hypothetical protein